MRDTDYSAHPFRSSVEVAVPEKASNEPGYFVLSNPHDNQVASMPEARQIKTCIAREEGDTTLPTQENNDLFVLQTLAANVDSNLPRRPP